MDLRVQLYLQSHSYSLPSATASENLPNQWIPTQRETTSEDFTSGKRAEDQRGRSQRKDYLNPDTALINVSDPGRCCLS